MSAQRVCQSVALASWQDTRAGPIRGCASKEAEGEGDLANRRKLKSEGTGIVDMRSHCMQATSEAMPAEQQDGCEAELGPRTPDAGLDEGHAWHIRVCIHLLPASALSLLPVQGTTQGSSTHAFNMSREHYWPQFLTSRADVLKGCLGCVLHKAAS